MFLPMWLVVILVLLGALGVWALILFIGFMSKMIDNVMRIQNTKKNDGNTAL